MPVPRRPQPRRQAARRSPDRWGSSAPPPAPLSRTALVVAAFQHRDRLPLLPGLSGGGDLHRLVALRAAALKSVRADYRVLNPRTHVGEVLRAMYRVESATVSRSRGSSSGTSRPSRSACPAASSAFRRAARASGWRGDAHPAGQLPARCAARPRGRPVRAVQQRDGRRAGHGRRRLPRGRTAAALAAAALTDRRHDAGSPPLRAATAASGPTCTVTRSTASTGLDARHGELHVEFDLEQAADLWITLDLDRGVHAGVGNDASVRAGRDRCRVGRHASSPTTARWR